MRTFILDSADKMKLLGAFLRSTGFEKPLRVVVTEDKSKRSNEQNKLLWKRLGEVSQQAMPRGQRFSDEVWHEYLKRELLPEECAKGVNKWDYLPTGEKVLKMGTPDLNVEEMTTYLDKLAAHVATEYGVELSA